MAGLTWLHLSDWHQHGREFDREVIRDALIRDIYQRKEISPDLARVDFIVFSGDVAFSGKAEEYQAAIENLFDPVLEVTGLSRDRLFIVPGNHDLDRTAFELLSSSLLKPFESESQVQEWLTDKRRLNLLLEPFAAYKQFVSKYTGQETPDYASVRRLEINNIRIALLGLNSALMTGRKNEQGEIDDFGKLIVGESQIYEHLKQIDSDDVRIAVLHHPLKWLAKFDRMKIEKYLGRTCHFILYGNEHDPRVVTPTKGDYVLIPAGASYARRDWAVNYNFVHLDFEGGRGTVYLRRWSDRRHKWLKDVDAYDEGVYQFPLPKTLLEPSVGEAEGEKRRSTLAANEELRFDVFLAHNSVDKPQVRAIAKKLEQRGLRPWLDEEQIAPGELFQVAIQKAIPQIKSAAIFIGSTGLGKWQAIELQTLISQFVNRGSPVIPVLLPGIDRIPDNLPFLQQFNWIIFENIDDAAALSHLEWGITGSKPSLASLEFLRQSERKKRFKQLLNELSAPGVEDRIRAVEALGKIELVDSDAKVAVSAVIAALKDKNVQVRQAAANTLGQMGGGAKEAVPTLIQALEDEDADVRRNAAKALGDIGDEAALPALKEVLNDTLIRDVVNTALLKISSVQEQKIRDQYSVWSKQIRQSLYELNSASLAQFPAVHRDFILQEFSKKFDFLNLVFHQDTATLGVSEREIINGFSEAWRQAKIAMQQHNIEKFRNETDRLTHFLCQALNFKFLDNSATQGQFYGRMLDASNPAFSLNIRNEFPVIYACHTEFNEEDVAMGVTSLLYWFKIQANFFALLIVFSNLQELRQQVRESAYKNDFIVLTYNHLWDILAAKAPIQQLTNCILEQIDLVFLSPYTVGGPVPEKMFFGRAEEEKILLQNIERKDYALLANRKSGKTSLLNKIHPRLQAIPNHQVFYCDLQAVNDYETFYSQLSLSYPELEEKISKIAGSSPSGFQKLSLDIKQRYSDKKIIFIFDEVDEILAYDIQENEHLFKVFRSLSQRQNIRFIFSGTTTLVKRTRHPDSPLFNFCNPIKLGLLEEKAARELVTIPMGTLGVKFENESAIVQRILDLTAQHPNIIQYICDALIQRINKKLERTIEEQDLDMVVTSQEFYDYFESLIWGQSTALEKLIVYAMWSYPEFTESEVIEEFKRREIPSEGVKASLEILLTYSTLSKKNDKYFFTFREFAKLMEKRSDIPTLTEQYKREIGGSEA